MRRKLLYVLLSVVLLSAGWLGGSGFALLVALVPLLAISSSYGASARDWRRMAGWAALTFLLWNAATVWWVWIATPIGPLAAAFFTTFWCMAAFMLYHYVSKRAPKGLAYAVLVAAWLAAEYLYTHSEVISFPWLTLGNGFSGVPWAVQWYEWTGVAGGSLWVLGANIALFEALRSRTRRASVRTAAVMLLPVAVSAAMYLTYEPEEEKVRISVIQPNVDCYDEKFDGDTRGQMENLLSLVDEVPRDVRFVVMPETALPERLADEDPQASAAVRMIRGRLAERSPEAMAAVGATTMKVYPAGMPHSETARAGRGFYYDYYNAAVAVNGDGAEDVHHKMRLVIGVEAMPFPRLLRWLSFQSVDLGGITGQLGRSDGATVFHKGGVAAGPAICYEGLYGDSFAEFVRGGAEVMLVLSNDGWWGDTPGYRRLFDFCRLRAIETPRAVAHSANTGKSGFITSRGDVVESLGWDERGVLTSDVEVSQRITAYVRFGDWIGRLSLAVTAMCLLCYSAYRVKRRNHLVN